ncbi:MAG: ATP-dependent DNA helicase RecG [Planctomycetota bacterium]|nr:MAG: ATP-dependent DNA helicase RecG [Planctomycetota bacterium]
MNYDAKRALELLRIGSGIPGAEFRDGQEEAIRRVVEGRGRLLVVQKTGWGKSFVYFIATRLLREAGLGPALLISPLLSLMRNQIDAAERMGVRAVTINSDNRDDWEAVERLTRQDKVDILLISPERLGNERFSSEVLGELSGRASMLVIDEAHCISDWGHDFRPDYRRLERMIGLLPSSLRVLATTATANDRVMADLTGVLGPDMASLRGDLGRPSLLLQTIELPGQAERLAWLAGQLATIEGHGIIYTLTVRDAQLVTAWLRSRGLNVQAYTGNSGDRRPELELALLRNEVKALVATMALGMGFDKPDLAFVMHYQAPGSVVAYYQQVGRAGRALAAAHGALLGGDEDTEITSFFIESAFPSRQEVRLVLGVLEDAVGGLTIHELLRAVNISQGRVTKTLKLLSLESPAPIVKEGSKWQLTAAELGASFWERAERLTALRRTEQQQMQDYLQLDSGHMEFLIRALDGDVGEAGQPDLAPLSRELDPGLLQDALDFLHRRKLPIQPRKKWPAGGLPAMDVSGRIEPEQRAEPGMALSIWGDAGWGQDVSNGKYSDGRFSNELVAACQEVLEEWAPEPRPAWVTCIPSRRHPELVPEFARRLADNLGLPFRAVLIRTDDRPEQKTMQNSVQQALNVDGSMEVSEGRLPDGPLLLIDDMLDSRWTLTVAAYLLRMRGAGPVFPLALALAGGGGQ